MIPLTRDSIEGRQWFPLGEEEELSREDTMLMTEEEQKTRRAREAGAEYRRWGRLSERTLDRGRAQAWRGVVRLGNGRMWRTSGEEE